MTEQNRPSVFKSGPTDYMNQYMFFGNPVSTARYDVQKIEHFETLINKQLSFFWRPEEVDVSQDRIDYANLSEHEKHIFISNLKYQTLLDSIQGRSPNIALLPICSLPEVETWIETWSFSECLAEGTEVLTQDGWKDLGETTVEDQCLVYNLENDEVFFEHPKRVPEYDVSGDIVRFKSKNGKQFDQLVTPNHRMPIIHRVRPGQNGKRYFNEAGKQDYAPHHLAPISGFKRTGKAMPLSGLERLLVAIQADGSVSDRYNGKNCSTIPVIFSFSKERKIERLKNICTEAAIELVELTPGAGEGNRKPQRRFKAILPIDLLDDIDPKRFDWVDPTAVSAEWAEDFLEEVSHWDSHRFHEDYGTTFCFTTTVKEVADKVQAVSAICGKSPRLTIRKDDRSDNYNDIYALNIVDRYTKDGQSIEKTLEAYTGKVRCLETSTGAFVIRYNGVVSVTGNTIHSRSYTHILRNIVNQPEEIFDDITINPHILERAERFGKYYDDLIHNVALYQHTDEHHTPEQMTECKRHFLRCLVSVNALEALAFYVSFACSFAFAERKKMEGNAKIIKLVCKDESLHLSGTEYMINLIRFGKDDPELTALWKEMEEELFDIYKAIAEQEKDWAEYLFKDGSMLGLNKTVLELFIEYLANIRLPQIGFRKPYPDHDGSNPLPWFSSWVTDEELDSINDAVQVAPQEAEVESYTVGSIDMDADDIDFDESELGF